MQARQSLAIRLLTILGTGLVIIGLLVSSTLDEMKDQREDNAYVSLTLKLEREINNIQRTIIRGYASNTYVRASISNPLLQHYNDYKNKILENPTYADNLVLIDNLVQIEDKINGIEKIFNKHNNQLITDDAFNLLTSEMMSVVDLLEINKTTFVRQVRLTTGAVSKKINTIGLIAGLFIILLCVFIIRNIVLPLRKISKTLSQHLVDYRRDEINYKSPNELGILVNQYNQLSAQVNSYQEMNVKINEVVDFHEVVEFTYKNFKRFLPYNRIGVSILTQSKKKVRAVELITDGKVRLDSNYTLPLDKTSLGVLIESKEIRIINDLEAYYREHQTSDSTKKILQEGIQSNLTIPLYVAEKCIGFLFFSSTQKNVYNQSHAGFAKIMADPLANAIQKSFMHEDLILTTINGFAKLVEERDEDTGNHLERMKAYCELVAKLAMESPKFKNEINQRLLFTITRHSVLHDIGKIGISDAILLKNGRLTPEEFDIIKTHPVIGARILEEMSEQTSHRENNIFNDAIDIVKHHHEKYDGSGYPEGLRGKNIPMVARIVAIGDVFDAVSSKRVYKEGFGFNESFKILLDGSGSHFDPDLIEIVEKHQDDFYQLYKKFHKVV